jgi:hypothetical protein
VREAERQTKVIAMLSEIFILRLETAWRVLPKTLPLSPFPLSNSRFVPFDGSIAFKEQRRRLAEPVPNCLNPEMGAVQDTSASAPFGYPY